MEGRSPVGPAPVRVPDGRPRAPLECWAELPGGSPQALRPASTLRGRGTVTAGFAGWRETQRKICSENGHAVAGSSGGRALGTRGQRPPSSASPGTARAWQRHDPRVPVPQGLQAVPRRDPPAALLPRLRLRPLPRERPAGGVFRPGAVCHALCVPRHVRGLERLDQPHVP